MSPTQNYLFLIWCCLYSYSASCCSSISSGLWLLLLLSCPSSLPLFSCPISGDPLHFLKDIGDPAAIPFFAGPFRNSLVSFSYEFHLSLSPFDKSTITGYPFWLQATLIDSSLLHLLCAISRRLSLGYSLTHWHRQNSSPPIDSLRFFGRRRDDWLSSPPPAVVILELYDSRHSWNRVWAIHYEYNNCTRIRVMALPELFTPSG